MNATTVQEAEVLEMQPAAHHPAPVVQQAREVTAAAASATPAQLLQMAVQQGADLDRLERLMALQERWEANEARKAYTQAKAAFMAESVTVKKDKENKQFGSRYATLGAMVQALSPALAKHGLAHEWDIKQDGDNTTVTCYLSHKLGHKEGVSFRVPPDKSGAKNAIQQIKSAITYAKGVTFESVTGLAACDEANVEDDGNDAGHGAQHADPTSPQDHLRARIVNAVKMAKTLADLDQAQKDGRKALNETRDRAFFQTFVAEVQAKGAQLRAGQQQGGRRV